LFFFFSSRRRHTRFSRDWSSDVCSSDLQQLFSEAQRTFSSGCVRVEGALTLVDLLLSKGEHERVTALLETGRTHEYRLNRPLPKIGRASCRERVWVWGGDRSSRKAATVG